MRKSICLLISGLFIAALLAGCVLPQQATSGTTDPTTTTGGPTIPSQPTDPTEPTDPTDPGPGEELPEPQELSFEYGALHIPLPESTVPTLYVIRSAEEMDTFIADVVPEEEKSFMQSMAYELGHAYYEDHTLFFVALYNDKDYPVEHKVRQLIRQPDGNYSLYVDTIALEGSSSYIRSWYLMVEVDGTIDAEAEIHMEMTDAKKLRCDFQFVMTHLHGETPDTTPVITILRSPSELNDYRISNAAVLDDTQFDESAAIYDESYFSDHTLVVISVEAETDSRYYDVLYLLQYPDNQYVICMEIGIFDEGSETPDARHLLIEIDGLLPEDTEIMLETQIGYWRDD